MGLNCGRVYFDGSEGGHVSALCLSRIFAFLELLLRRADCIFVVLKKCFSDIDVGFVLERIFFVIQNIFNHFCSVVLNPFRNLKLPVETFLNRHIGLSWIVDERQNIVLRAKFEDFH